MVGRRAANHFTFLIMSVLWTHYRPKAVFLSKTKRNEVSFMALLIQSLSIFRPLPGEEIDCSELERNSNYHFHPLKIYMQNFTKYIRQTMSELRQVSWPSQRQTIMYTILVIAISAVVALFVGAFDYLFSQGINFLINGY